ncbi:MAG: CoA ester lyase [Rhizobiaceae bacterium]|nr:CoA ester lyase [Rhizobiaceae bacterium]
MRSLLFVPADSERKQEKGLVSGADALILDLEDSVAPSAKAEGRRVAAKFLRANTGAAPLLYVRVNDFTTGMTADDLAAVMPARPHGIMLPKAVGADDVARLDVALRVLEAENGIADGATRMVPLITETAQSLLLAATHARPNPRLSGITWGAEDLSASVGASSYRDGDGRLTPLFQHARTMTLLAAAAAGTAAIDTVNPDFRNEDAFARECADALRDGFTAKMAIHPAQVAHINAAFTPTREALAHARAIIDAFAAAGDAGVIAIGGKMYDRPHVRLAERLLARAPKG